MEKKEVSDDTHLDIYVEFLNQKLNIVDYLLRHTYVCKCIQLKWKRYVLSSHFLLGLGHEEKTAGGRQKKSFSIVPAFSVMFYFFHLYKDEINGAKYFQSWILIGCYINMSLFIIVWGIFQISQNNNNKKSRSKLRTERKSLNIVCKIYM